MEFNHKPVLLNECIDGLKISEQGIYVDGTLGGAGHSAKIIEKLSEKGLLIGIDRDEEALQVASKKLEKYQNVKYIHGNHDNIEEILNKLKIEKVNGILLDLGISSYQIDEKTRGFSYMEDSKLDMRMDKTQKFTAKDVLNNYTEKQISEILYEYGEEKFSRQIAKNICKHREIKMIETTKQLVEIINESVPNFAKREGHPAKRTFQAIRIEVNNEIQPLYDTITQSIKCLENEGRLCAITFHSLEDRAVKKAFSYAEGKCICPSDLPYCVCNYKSYGKIVNKKPILPNEQEQNDNSRSRSAKLRIFERKI